MKITPIALVFGLMVCNYSHAQEDTYQDVGFTLIAKGTDSPITDLQIVCYNKFFNKDYLPSAFVEKYNLTDKNLFKKNMLVEIFQSDIGNQGWDTIELVGVKENSKTLVIAYNLINANQENDGEALAPFLIAQIPKSKKEVKFVANGIELGKGKKLYLD
ncbi:hypothetical protein GTQ34_08325 [Muricauda sp. JGD-17]|uniref:Uncharacterized protein n=1 Tax=Flagellimonas ochracea TaxID=2696472 RepID=A0A964TEC4_9FLAO|nr:hypothetical protein [Allomuricauda ochracea]NAY91921.1 hypothetical protein [Allomuricauda ochracea]